MTHFDDFNDDLAGIFDNLTPEDFLHMETTAVGISALAAHDADFDGEQAFARFVARSLDTVRTSYAAAEGEINPVAILATKAKHYVFVPDEDEDMEGWSNRLRRESAKLGARWVFICRKTLVGKSADVDEGALDVTDEDIFERAAADGRMRPGILFYAQRKEEGELEHFHGYIHCTSATELGDVVMGRAGQRVPLFDVLGEE